MASSGKDNRERVDLATAKHELLKLSGVGESETVPSEKALGRVTAAPVQALMASPHYRGSAMDGIAVIARATRGASATRPVTLREVGVTGGDERVCCVVDTGNPLPPWADAVVRKEATRAVTGGFEVSAPVAPGRDVRAVGEDIAAGATVLPRGHRIRPFDVGALLATGVYEVAVRRMPRVAVIATGGEIVEPGVPPAPGQIVEYNSRMLDGFVREAGGTASYLGRCPDDPRALESIVREAATGFDLVCVIAGSSRGRKDFTLEALAAAGDLRFQGVAVMPGKPTGLAVVEGKPVLAIPGYPVSAVVAYRELVSLFLTASLGLARTVPERIAAVVRRDTPSRLGVEEMLRVCLAADGDDLVVAPLAGGAGSVATLVGADAILRVPASSEGMAGGTRVEVELLRPRNEIGRTIVVAGRSHPLFAAAEDRLRADGVPLRFAYLKLSQLDAVSALAVGEAHCALFSHKDGCGLPDARSGLAARCPGWKGYVAREKPDGELLLACTPAFLRSSLAAGCAAWRSVTEARGYEVTSTE